MGSTENEKASRFRSLHDNPGARAFSALYTSASRTRMSARRSSILLAKANSNTP